MKNLIFTNSEAIADQREKMEAETIAKNGASSKSCMSRGNFYKIVAMIAIALCVVFETSAQKGDMAVGGNLLLGSGGSYTHFGVGGKFLYNITDPVRLAAEFDFFPRKDYFSWWDFSVFGHYVFSIGEKIAVYPLVGAGIMGVQMKIDYRILDDFTFSTSGFVFTPGAGGEYKLSSNLSVNAELRYKFITFSNFDLSGNRTYLAAGVTYKF